MSVLARAVGAGVPVTLTVDGEPCEYLVSGLRLSDWGVLTNCLRKQRPNLMHAAAEAAAGLPPDTQRMLFREAADSMSRTHTIPLDEVIRWAESLEGLPYALWVSLERHHAGQFSPEKIRGVLADMTDAQVGELIDALTMAAGTDAMGNSTGAAQTAPTNPAEGKKRRGRRSSGGSSSQRKQAATD